MSVGLSEAKSRLDRTRGALRDMDRKIESLEHARSIASGAEALEIARELRGLAEQRVTAMELLDVAEGQHSARRAEHDAQVAEAAGQLGQRSKTLHDAARRFDRALEEALGALGEIEREAEPLVGTLLPGGLRDFTHPRCVRAAIDKAFEPIFGRAVQHAEKRSMSDRIGDLVSLARENAAQRKQEAA